MIRKEIKKGVNFSTEFSDKFKTSMIVVNFCVPLSDKNAATFSLLSEVMKRGCKSLPTYKDISKKLIDIYSSFGCYVFKKGESLCFGIYNSFIDSRYIVEKQDSLELNIDFLTQFLFDPLIDNIGFSEEYINQEKINLVNRINEKINDKANYSVTRCIQLMCEKENFSVMSTGSVDSVKNVSNEDLLNAYNCLINNSCVDIYYYGSNDEKHVYNCFESLFNRFVERNNNEYPKTKSVSNIIESRKIVENIEATQGNLVIGYRTDSNLCKNNHHSMVLYNEILGSSPISKLFINVREKKSLCYYCGSSYDPIKGIMLISSGISVSKFDEALEAIFLEVDRMKKGEITEEEISCAKSSLVNSYNEIYDSPFALINWHHTRHILGITQDPKSFSLAIQSLTKKNIIDVARNIKLDTIYFLKGINNVD